ncbi:hypothetical protein GCM10009682_30420 [Luedemannella flava]|uniref:FlgD/Vpr Ig-like domain-containing protein n=1 Tax=Luedemannella flava TaxID=349316 RepID=A0ABN2M4M3_9ACTN
MATNRRLVLRAAVVLSVVVTGLVTASAHAETAPVPSELTTLTPKAPLAPPAERIVFVGRTGFLHLPGDAGTYVWTRYDTGASTDVDVLTGAPYASIRAAGPDSVSTHWELPQRPAPGAVTIVNLLDRSVRQFAAPDDWSEMAVFNANVLIGKIVDGQRLLRLVTLAEDGTIAASLDLPTMVASTSGLAPMKGDGSRVVIWHVEENVRQNRLIDMATGRIAELVNETGARTFTVSGDAILASGFTGLTSTTVRRYSFTSLMSGDASGISTTVSTGATTAATMVAAVGGHVLADLRDTSAVYNAPRPLVDYTATGHEVLLPSLAYLAGNLIQGPDNTALAVGGSGVDDWAVHRYAWQADGDAVVDTVVAPVREADTTAGLTLAHGVVRQVRSTWNADSTSRIYTITGMGLTALGGAGAEYSATLPASVSTCATDVRCVRMVGGDAGRAAYVGHKNTSPEVFMDGQRWVSVAAGSRIVDASHTHVVVDDPSSGQQRVYRYNTAVRTGDIQGAALWFDRLWTATATASQVAEVDLKTGTTLRTVTTAAPCRPTELQIAAGRWLYWSCGAEGPAGVYDVTTKASIAVPADPALVGDGYVVVRADGELRLIDIHEGAAAPAVKLADVAPGVPADDRNVTWTVDRFSGDVAYADADGRVHIIDPGVAPSAPVAIEAMPSLNIVHPKDANPWHVWATLSQPVKSWSLALVRKSTGVTVRTVTGGATRVQVDAAWDGRTAAGAIAPSGEYTWRLSVVGARSTDPVTISTATTHVYCGAQPFRSYDCLGTVSMLAVRSTGEAHWFGGLDNGSLKDWGYTESWPLGTFTAIVPFGDINGDGHNDVLARDSGGVLRAYLGRGYNNFSRDSVTNIRIGSGWNQYPALVAAGDLTGDGRDDLLARDAGGALWRYNGNGKGGFAARVKIGTGWNAYKRLVGAGDLTSDRHGDLLGIDASGVLWRYNGRGNGTFAARVRIGTGWGVYNALVGIGDLNLDGRNDLVARDASGNLWFYAGRGNGTFAAKVKKGTGFTAYKAIF